MEIGRQNKQRIEKYDISDEQERRILRHKTDGELTTFSLQPERKKDCKRCLR